MRQTASIRFYALLFAAILFAAHIGQQVHIYNEDHAHFAAHCGDLVPDNGAMASVVEKCYVDNFDFFFYTQGAATVASFYFGVLATLQPEATHCKLFELAPCLSLRAPPVA